MSDKLISIKQFADMQGITTAAVYKKLSTTLKKYAVSVENVDNAKKAPIQLNMTAMQRDGFITVDRNAPESEPAVYNVDNTKKLEERIAALEEKLTEREERIAELKEQQHIKDEQISAYMEENRQLIQNMADKEKTISELARSMADMAKLTDQSQQLQAHTQLLLEEQKTTAPQKSKKGLFGWLFGTPQPVTETEPDTAKVKED